MTDKIVIEELPVTQERVLRRRLIQERGEIAFLENGNTFNHLAYISLNRGEGFFRGGHYHRQKIEHLYVLSGQILIRFVDLDTGQKGVVAIGAGERVTIHPHCAHRFEAQEDAQMIEYYASMYDPQDDCPYTEFS